MSSPPVLSFADFEWRGPEQRLLRAGEPLELGHRAFELLGLLASKAGQVVSKDEAFARVWAGRVVEENNLQVQVSTLRRLLGRDAIATVPGQGYRFTLAVHNPLRAQEPVAAPAPSPEHAPLLLGRDADLRTLRQLLADHSLVTVVGEGGIGKTTLARALMPASGQDPHTHWVDLSALQSPSELASALAAALGLRLPPGQDETEALLAAWPPSAQCLVLDNCEHLVEDLARLLARLYALSPGLRVLATSQLRLNLSHEQVHRLAPLALPVGDELGAAQASAAVQLLVRRVQAGLPGFALGAGNAAALCALCRQLDGLALAIELAAAQVVRLGLPAVCERLGERLRLLTGGPLDRPERQRTLAATMAWSHGLLDEPERRVLRRLAVFAGGFDLGAALAVVTSPDLDDWSATEALATLVERCLLTVLPGPDSDAPPRYRLLESTRAFALGQLQAAGERRPFGERHARWMHQRFEQAFEELGTRSDTGWRAAFEPELDNLRAALNFCLVDAAAPELGIGLAGWSADLWPILSLLDEGRRHLEAARQHLRPDTAPREAAALWDGIGYLWQDADPSRALDARLRAEALWRQAGDRRWVRSVLGQAWNRLYLDQLSESEAALADTADAVASHPHLRALHRTTLGALRQRQSRHAEALAAYEEALSLRRRQGDARRTLIMLLNLGDLACSSGQPAAAVDWGRQAEAEALRLDDPALLGVILGNLTTAHLFLGEVAAAEDCARRAAPLLRHSDGLVFFLDTLAWLCAQQGRPVEAAHLLGCADAALSRRAVVRQPAEERVVQVLGQALGQALNADRLARCQAEGATWSDAQALACALP